MSWFRKSAAVLLLIIVENLTNSNFVLVYKGFWKVWDGRIVGVGFEVEGLKLLDL